MVQLSRFEKTSLILQFLPENLLFLDNLDINVRSSGIFETDRFFDKLDGKILAANNKIRCVRYHWATIFIMSSRLV